MEINWALVLLLTAEFQGFARDLHSEAAERFARSAAGPNEALYDALLTTLTTDRALRRGNPHPDALAKDFGRLGIDWWTSLAARDVRTAKRQQRLLALVQARNAIAHSDHGETPRDPLWRSCAMVKGPNSELKPGEVVTLSTGKNRLVGTVSEIYGPPDRRWATVDVIVTGSSGEPLTTTSTAVPTDRLHHVELRRDASWRACAGSILIGSQPVPVVLLDSTWRQAGLGQTADCRGAIAHRAAAFAALDRSDPAPEKRPRARDGLLHIVVQLRHVHEAMKEKPYADSIDERY